MGMSGMYGPADRGEGIATINAALDSGLNLLDTGDFYGMGHNELLIAEAIRWRPRVRRAQGRSWRGAEACVQLRTGAASVGDDWESVSIFGSMVPVS